MLKIIVLIVFVSQLLFAEDTLRAYSMCGQYPFIPKGSLEAGYSVKKLEYGVDGQSKEEVESTLGVNGPEFSGRLKVANGLIYGNVSYIEVVYKGLSGQTYSSSRSSTIVNNRYQIEANFYEYGMEYEYVNYLKIGVGYQEWERLYSDISHKETLKNPYLHVGVGYGTPFNKNWWGVVDAEIIVAPFGKIDVFQSNVGQTLDQELSYGYKIGFELFWLAYENVSFSLKPSFKHWEHGKTDTIQGFYVEEASSTEFSFSIHMTYSIY